jgi:hypothetical protein
MPIYPTWLDDSRSILVITYTKELTWEEFYAFFTNHDTDVYRHQHPMCVIHLVEYLPPGSLLPRLKLIMDVTPPRIVGAVVVMVVNGAAQALLSAMLKVLARLRPAPGMLETASTLDEAIAICRQRLRSHPGGAADFYS